MFLVPTQRLVNLYAGEGKGGSERRKVKTKRKLGVRVGEDREWADASFLPFPPPVPPKEIYWQSLCREESPRSENSQLDSIASGVICHRPNQRLYRRHKQSVWTHLLER